MRPHCYTWPARRTSAVAANDIVTRRQRTEQQQQNVCVIASWHYNLANVVPGHCAAMKLPLLLYLLVSCPPRRRALMHQDICQALMDNTIPMSTAFTKHTVCNSNASLPCHNAEMTVRCTVHVLLQSRLLQLYGHCMQNQCNKWAQSVPHTQVQLDC